MKTPVAQLVVAERPLVRSLACLAFKDMKSKWLLVLHATGQESTTVNITDDF